jgi:hypothetical protein
MHDHTGGSIVSGANTAALPSIGAQQCGTLEVTETVMLRMR